MAYHTSYAQARGLLPTQGARTGVAVAAAALAMAPLVLPAFYVGEMAFIFILCINSRRRVREPVTGRP